MRNIIKNRITIILTTFTILLTAGCLFSQIDENTPSLDMFLGGDAGINQNDLEKLVKDTSGGLRGPGSEKKRTRIVYVLETAIRKSDSTMLKRGIDSLKSLLNRDDDFTTGQKKVTFILSGKYKTGDAKRVILPDSTNVDTCLLRHTRNIFKSQHFKGNAIYNQKIKLSVSKSLTQ